MSKLTAELSTPTRMVRCCPSAIAAALTVKSTDCGMAEASKHAVFTNTDMLNREEDLFDFASRRSSSPRE